MSFPPFITASFLLLLAVMFFFMMAGLNLGLKRLNHPKRNKILFATVVGVLLWLMLTGYLAENGFIRNWQALPPLAIFILIPPIVFMIWLVNQRGFLKFIDNIPHHHIIYLQSFRIFVELILWALLLHDIIPIQMTFEGYNFDVFVGLSAIYIGRKMVRKEISNKAIILWNIVGLILVTNIVVISAISTSSPIRVFMNEPPNMIIGCLPFVWLPSFLVMIAYLLHFISIKQILMKQ